LSTHASTFLLKVFLKVIKSYFVAGIAFPGNPAAGYFLKSGSAAATLNSWLNYGRMLIAAKIEYKKINIFCSDPLPDLRPDLESVWISCCRLYVWFSKKLLGPGCRRMRFGEKL